MVNPMVTIMWCAVKKPQMLPGGCWWHCKNDMYVLSKMITKTNYTSRETTFDPARNLALVPVFFTSRTRETFSPGL